MRIVLYLLVQHHGASSIGLHWTAELPDEPGFTLVHYGPVRRCQPGDPQYEEGTEQEAILNDIFPPKVGSWHQTKRSL